MLIDEWLWSDKAACASSGYYMVEATRRYSTMASATGVGAASEMQCPKDGSIPIPPTLSLFKTKTA